MTSKPKVSRKAKAVSPASRIADAVRDETARAQSTPQKTAVVGKIGWENGNEIIPIVLVDKKLRAQVGVEPRGIISVKKGDKISVALVQIQFWELVGTGKATINSMLAGELDAAVGDTISFETATEEQVAAFQRLGAQRVGAGIAAALDSMMRAQRGDEE